MLLVGAAPFINGCPNYQLIIISPNTSLDRAPNSPITSWDLLASWQLALYFKGCIVYARLKEEISKFSLFVIVYRVCSLPVGNDPLWP